CGFMTKSVGNGLLVQAIDPGAFDDREVFLDRVEAYVEYVRSATPREGVARILLPGEPEEEVAARRREEGIDVDEGTWAQIARVASEEGVPLS
ncbi:MAG TPA: Ldh family oxidoreductase, partial [Planctomycetota bacterium]|nr:Ldh family oxidoreductase [Planctomycetota bacterium]